MDKNPNGKKTSWLGHLLIYLVCLLAACATWLFVMYAQQTAQSEEDETILLTADVCLAENDRESEASLYV